MSKRCRGTQGIDTDTPPLVTVKVMKGTETVSVKVDPSKYGFLSIQLQDEAYAEQFVNNDEVIADLSEAALGPELAADIATTLDVADERVLFRVTVPDVRMAAQTLRGADYLQLRKELYLKQVVALLKQAAAEDSDVPPTSAAKEVVPCVHTGQLVWDHLGAYTVLRLEQKGIISLGHKGIIKGNSREKGDNRIDDELLALANVLNDVTSLDISGNESITTCEPFADTLVELKARWSGIADEGLKLCTKLRKLDVSGVEGITSCTPFADTLEELVAEDASCGITDASLESCRKIRKLTVNDNPNVTTCAAFADTLEEVVAADTIPSSRGLTDASLKYCRKIRKLSVCHNPNVTTCAPFADTLEELDARGFCEMTSDAIQCCTKLRKLNVGSNIRMTTCDSLKHLEELRPSPGFTAASLRKVAEQCHRLKHLDVASYGKELTDVVTDAVMQKFAENCRWLQYLNVSGAVHLTDSSIIAVAEKCPLLRFLNVTMVMNITDKAMIKVVEQCPQLRGLNITGNNAITDTAIIKVAENCPDLEELNVLGTSNITDASIKKVAEHCPRLQELNVAGTKGRITNASIVEIAKNCPSLVRVTAYDTGGNVGGDALRRLLPWESAGPYALDY